MNTQIELEQINSEIAELKTKLEMAQKRQDVLASANHAVYIALCNVDDALNVLVQNFGANKIAEFKLAIDSKFTDATVNLQQRK